MSQYLSTLQYDQRRYDKSACNTNRNVIQQVCVKAQSHDIFPKNLNFTLVMLASFTFILLVGSVNYCLSLMALCI